MNIESEISNNIRLRGIPGKLYSEITDTLTSENKAYTDAVKLNRYTPDIKSKETRSSSFTTACEWLSRHKFELLGFGWTPAELYRRNKSQGIAWLRLWDNPNLQVFISRTGAIVFSFVNHTGNQITQTAFPRRARIWKR